MHEPDGPGHVPPLFLGEQRMSLPLQHADVRIVPHNDVQVAQLGMAGKIDQVAQHFRIAAAVDVAPLHFGQTGRGGGKRQYYQQSFRGEREPDGLAHGCGFSQPGNNFGAPKVEQRQRQGYNGEDGRLGKRAHKSGG